MPSTTANPRLHDLPPARPPPLQPLHNLSQPLLPTTLQPDCPRRNQRLQHRSPPLALPQTNLARNKRRRTCPNGHNVVNLNSEHPHHAYAWMSLRPAGLEVCQIPTIPETQKTGYGLGAEKTPSRQS
ncbi:hypothetical protein ACN42_g8758 [Penicillium freii]|uniref:Uncharacterized protein n=1 Tax=Penicillium freii TaxID=48697 RepID=A0A101MD63_PENFR|nr:hypothetical protein ACN42_g8758 [Penicillium freii]